MHMKWKLDFGLFPLERVEEELETLFVRSFFALEEVAEPALHWEEERLAGVVWGVEAGGTGGAVAVSLPPNTRGRALLRKKGLEGTHVRGRLKRIRAEMRRNSSTGTYGSSQFEGDMH